MNSVKITILIISLLTLPLVAEPDGSRVNMSFKFINAGLQTKPAKLKNACLTVSYTARKNNHIQISFSNFALNEIQPAPAGQRFVTTPPLKNAAIEYKRTGPFLSDIRSFMSLGPALLNRKKITGNKPPFFKRSIWGLGLTGSGGIEWFFSKNMSFLAEFSFLYQYKMKYLRYSGGNNNSGLSSTGTTDITVSAFDAFTRFGFGFSF